MFKHVAARGFKGVPHLETSLLAQNHPEGISFSNEKPNVVVGPNGAGKSALMTALAYKTLSWTVGESTRDPRYLDSFHFGELWDMVDDSKSWRQTAEFMKGLICETDLGPAFYYQPRHQPGGEEMLTTAMMCGYSKEAHEYRRLTQDKSSGQQCLAILDRIRLALRGEGALPQYHREAWGRHSLPLENIFWSESDYRRKHMESAYASDVLQGKPVILMDEPEQSLDAFAELTLWKDILAADLSKMQVIVATHSLYPLLHPERFNIIEANPGYISDVLGLLS